MKPLIITTLFAFAITSCERHEYQPEAPEPEAPSSPDPETVHPTIAPDKPILEGSLYDLESPWQNQNAEEKSLAEHFGGKIHVISMGYSTCKFACPALLADMRRIKDAFDEETLGKKLGFSFISIDPEVDTPARLNEFETESKFDPAIWTLLRSDADNVLELAVVLGMKYRKTTVDDFAHSNIITIIGEKGEILHQQEGINADPTETIALIKARLAASGE